MNVVDGLPEKVQCHQHKYQSSKYQLVNLVYSYRISTWYAIDSFPDNYVSATDRANLFTSDGVKNEQLLLFVNLFVEIVHFEYGL